MEWLGAYATDPSTLMISSLFLVLSPLEFGLNVDFDVV
jgi:hypothetical protein